YLLAALLADCRATVRTLAPAIEASSVSWVFRRSCSTRSPLELSRPSARPGQPPRARRRFPEL
ncbi:MAG TPA: hypothetical protein VK459_25780, partial [Polyangiaceae bacterium]|nr:hypothetical protein [Polyangiaceae bacterium]